MSELYWFLAFVIINLIWGAISIYKEYSHYREKKDIFAKFMARNLGEAEYFDKAYPGQVNQQLADMKKNSEKEKTPEEKAREVAAKGM